MRMRTRKLPVMLTSELAECGLACVAMVANYHGHEVDLVSLRLRFWTSSSGITMRHLIEFASELDLSPRAVRLDLNDLQYLKLPAILHWSFNHFVVLKSVRGNVVTIHDPAVGRRDLSLEEFGQHFTGVALELSRAPGFEVVRAKSPIKIRSLWTESRGLAPAVVNILVLSIVLLALTFVAPLQVQLVIDEAISRADSSLLLVIALGFAFIVILQAGIEAIRSWYTASFGYLLSYQMQGNLIGWLVRLAPSYFEKRHVGDILSRISSATQIQQLITTGLVATIVDGVMALLACTVLFFYSPLLALIVICFLVLSSALSISTFSSLRKLREEQIQQSAIEQTYLMETIRGIVPIQLMGREADRSSRWKDLYIRVVNSMLAISRWEISVTSGQTLLGGIQLILILYFGATLVIEQESFTLGMLMAFLAFRQTFSDRTVAFVNQIVQLRYIGLHLDRIADIVLADRPGVGGATGKSAVPQMTVGAGVDLDFNQISFRYSPSDPYVIGDLSLRVASGDFVAITGKSGCGKSTLIKLMLGLLWPTQGEIRMNGMVLQQRDWGQIRTKFGVVMQDDKLFSGTIAENIAFFDPEISMERIVDAAMKARVHSDIVAKPMQYNCLVGDMGSTLSGGQKQRILLARALYRNPELLILDEGTANLDPSTEEEIAVLIAEMNITRIVVAHRPALVTRANRVLVMEDGRLS